MQSLNIISPPDPARMGPFTSHVMRWGFIAVIAVIVLITALSFWRTEVDRQTMNDIVANRQAAMARLYKLQFAARERTFALITAVQTEDPFVRDGQIQYFYEQGRDFGIARTQLMQLKLDDIERNLLEQQGEQATLVALLMHHVIETLETGGRGEAEQLMINSVLPAQNRMIDILTALLEHEVRETNRHVALARKNQVRARALFLFAGLFGVLLTSGVLFLVSRRTGGLISHLTDTSERLKQSNLDLQFQKMALDVHCIMSISDVHGNITAVNDKFCEVSQYSREELLGQNHRILKSGQHPSAFYEALWATISAGGVWQGDICNRRKDGKFYWVASTILPFVGEDGLPTRYVSVRTDITPVKEAQRVLERSRDDLEQLVQARTRELAEREDLLNSIANAAQDAVIVFDPAGWATYWNPAAERMFGYAGPEMAGKRLDDLIPPEHVPDEPRAVFEHIIGPGEKGFAGRTMTARAKGKDGEMLPIEIALSSIKLNGRLSALGIVRDATERMKTEEGLKHLATTDALTGICNRRRFDEILRNEISRAARFNNHLALILLDVDHFKRINDTFGHPAGDRVLIQLALTVSHSIRTIDLFARWGGEEFVILAPGCDLSAGRLLAEKLRMVLEQFYIADVGHVTASFGVAEYAPGDSSADLINKADRCLYYAKKSGRNRVETTETTPVA